MTQVQAPEEAGLYLDLYRRMQLIRGFEELVSWLLRDNPVPVGSVLLTGTGLVPPDDFTLEPGQRIEIHVPGIGTLVNPVGRAADLMTEER